MLIFCSNMRKYPNLQLKEGESGLIGGYSQEFTDYRYFSGLRIKKDPGTKVVFAGFFLMTFGFISRYFPRKPGL